MRLKIHFYNMSHPSGGDCKVTVGDGQLKLIDMLPNCSNAAYECVVGLGQVFNSVPARED